MGRFIFRKTVLINCLRTISVLVILIAAKATWDLRLFHEYDPDLPLDAEVVEQGTLGGYQTEKIVITGLAGERIPLRLILPKGADSHPVGCVVFLYGIGQKMKFFEKIAPIFAAQGVAMALPEQYARGERRVDENGLWKTIVAFRNRTARLAPETRRVVDYLSQRRDLDAQKIDFMGVSYGAIMGCSVVAGEPRFRYGTLALVGGDFPRLFSSIIHRLHPNSSLAGSALAHAVAWFLKPYDPMYHVARIAPRPLLFLNVNADEIIDRACSKELFDAAGDPKKEIWYPGPHEAISEATISQMLNDALAWMKTQETPGSPLAARRVNDQ